MSYLEELLPEFRKGAKIRRKNWGKEEFIRKEDSDKHFYDEILKENVANNVAKPNSQHSEPNCNIMLKNPDASEGNVKGDNR